MSNKIKILIAEHDLTDIELLHHELISGGIVYESEMAQNKQDYIFAIGNFKPDIILSDYSFPSFDGIEAFEIKQQFVPYIPFIFVSGTIGEEKLVELIKNGVTDYVLKDKFYGLAIKVKRALKEAEDSMQKKKTDAELRKTNRLYAFISQINQNIVHIKDEKALFRNSCNIATTIGKFIMAWIGKFDTEGKKISVVEQCGISPEDMSLFTDTTFKENGPQHHVLNTGKNYICNDILHESLLENWKPFASVNGIQSCMVLPIRKAGNIIGTLNLYSTELNFFDNEEIRLLIEATGDISFALDLFAKAKRLGKAKVELKASNKRYSDLFYLSPQPMWVFDPVSYKFIQVNKATIDLYGYSKEEFLNMTLMDIKLEEDILGAKEELKIQHRQGEVFKRITKHIKKSGEIIELEIYSTPIIINDIRYRSVIAIDVTEKRSNEHKIIKAIIKTQEDERYEIGGELHDNVCQLLATSQITLGMIRETVPLEKMIFFNQSKEYVSMALNEIRNLSHRLAPAFFDDSTLEEAFERLLSSFNIDKKYEMILRFDKVINNTSISQDIRLNLYRILQEQLKNILKYSKATIIELDILLDNNKLKMKINDNGLGFKIDTAKSGIGLANMKRRAELFSGKFKIISSPGNGCIVNVEIPISE